MVHGSQNFVAKNILSGNERQVLRLVASVGHHGGVLILRAHKFVYLAKACDLSFWLLINQRQRATGLASVGLASLVLAIAQIVRNQGMSIHFRVVLNICDL